MRPHHYRPGKRRPVVNLQKGIVLCMAIVLILWVFVVARSTPATASPFPTTSSSSSSSPPVLPPPISSGKANELSDKTILEMSFTPGMGKAWGSFTGEKGAVFEGEPTALTINGKTTASTNARLTFWGKSSAKLRLAKRRSLLVTTNPGETLRVAHNSPPLTKFMLMSLWEDTHRLAYASTAKFLENTGIWTPYTKLIEVKCTGHKVCTEKPSFGVYLLIEFPSNAIHRNIDKLGVPPAAFTSCLNTGRDQHTFTADSTIEIGARVWRYHPKPAFYDVIHFPSFKGNSTLSGLYKNLALVKNEIFAEKLIGDKRVLDGVQYLTWMGLNSLLMNGDYDDEVFLIKDEQGGIKIHAWDFDTVFQSCHKDGKFAIKNEPLLYCAEADFDRKILATPSLFASYKKILKCSLSTFATPDRWNTAVDSVLESLLRYFADPVVSKGSFEANEKMPDVTKGAEMLKKDFKNRYEFLSSELGGGMTTHEACQKPPKKEFSKHSAFSLSGGNSVVSIDKEKKWEGEEFSTSEGGGFCVKPCGDPFIVRDKARGGAEWGVPPYKRPLKAHDFHNKENEKITVTIPKHIPHSTQGFPIIYRLTEHNGRWVRKNLKKSEDDKHPELTYGAAAVYVKGDTENSNIDEEVGLASFEIRRDQKPGSFSKKCSVFTAGTEFSEDTCYTLSEHVTIAEGTTVTIPSGVFISSKPTGRLTIHGTLDIKGTEASPVYFAPHTRSSWWGGFAVYGKLKTEHTVISGTGGTAFKRIPETGSHRKETPAISVAEGGKLNMDQSGIVECKGPGFGAGKHADISIHNTVISNVQQGGECKICKFSFKSSSVMNIPNKHDATYTDGDNDGLYLSGGDHIVQDSVVAYTADDGIDSGTPSSIKKKGGTLKITGTIIDACQHEGVALSGVDRVATITDSVIIRCQQGVEMGYSEKTASGHVERSLLAFNMVGLRYGDNYMKLSSGKLVSTSTLFHGNAHLDIMNFVRKPFAPSKQLSVSGCTLGPALPSCPAYAHYDSKETNTVAAVSISPSFTLQDDGVAGDPAVGIRLGVF